MILNAAHLDNQLPLALQIHNLGMKPVLLVNMIDEAEQLGIRINARALSKSLDSPVILMSARNGTGIKEVRETLIDRLQSVRPAKPQELKAYLHADDELVERAESLVSEHVSSPSRLVRRMTERIDLELLHPLHGLPLFFQAMFMVFQAVYKLEAPLQDAVANLLE